MAAKTPEHIFVYGTLRRGGSRDAEVYYEGAEFVGAARVRGVLYDLGAYPGVRLDDRAGWVAGDIFTVTPEALAGLDEWEGIDADGPGIGEYRRVRADVLRENGAWQACWVYELEAARGEGRAVIASGDWLRG